MRFIRLTIFIAFSNHHTDEQVNTENMNVFSPFALLAFFLTTSSLQTLTSACSCMGPPPSIKQALYGDTDVVFVGRVIKQIKPDPTIEIPGKIPYIKNIGGDIQYLVKVQKMIKGCEFQKSEFVVVTTAADGSMCGVTLQEENRYLLSAKLVNVDKIAVQEAIQRGPIAAEVRIMSCGYGVNMEWMQVDLPDRRLLRQYTRLDQVCSEHGSCTTGSEDCLKGDYCDDGKCVAADAQCPFYMPMVRCLMDPCDPSLKPPCPEATERGATCISSYCGGCHAIWMDANRNRICKQMPEEVMY